MTQEIPDFWELDLGNSILRVDIGVAMEIRRAMFERTPIVDFREISGSRCIVYVAQIKHLTECTSAIREASYRLQAALKTERAAAEEAAEWD